MSTTPATHSVLSTASQEHIARAFVLDYTVGVLMRDNEDRRRWLTANVSSLLRSNMTADSFTEGLTDVEKQRAQFHNLTSLLSIYREDSLAAGLWCMNLMEVQPAWRTTSIPFERTYFRSGAKSIAAGDIAGAIQSGWTDPEATRARFEERIQLNWWDGNPNGETRSYRLRPINGAQGITTPAPGNSGYTPGDIVTHATNYIVDVDGEASVSGPGYVFTHLLEPVDGDSTNLVQDSAPEEPATPVEETEVQRLTRERDEARALARTNRQKHEQDMALLSEMLGQEAIDRDWCSEYETALETMNRSLTIGLTAPEQDYIATGTVAVDITIHVPISTRFTATRNYHEEQAGEALDDLGEDDIQDDVLNILHNLSQYDLNITNIDSVEDVEVEQD